MRESQTCVRHRALTSIVFVTLFVVALAPSATTRHQANAESLDTIVLDWNRHAYEAFGNAPTAPTPGIGMPPQVASVHMAIVQGAVYDAVNAIDGGYQPYLDGLEADETASTGAAAATAAHRVLVGIVTVPAFPQAVIDRLNTAYDASIADAS